jgi:hypothetical protein
MRIVQDELSPLLIPSHIKEDCMETLSSIILAELLTATTYLDRLLFAFSDLEKLHVTPKGKNQVQKLINDLNTFFIKEFKSFDLQANETDWSEFKRQVKVYHNAIEAMTKLPFTGQKMETMMVNYINLIYRNSYELHNFILQTTNLEIQFPRLGMIQEENIPSITQDDATERAPLFFLDETKLRSYRFFYRPDVKKNTINSFTKDISSLLKKIMKKQKRIFTWQEIIKRRQKS